MDSFLTQTTKETETKAPECILYRLLNQNKHSSTHIYTSYLILCLKQKHYIWKNKIECSNGMFLQKMVLIFSHICSLVKNFFKVTINRTISYISQCIQLIWCIIKFCDLLHFLLLQILSHQNVRLCNIWERVFEDRKKILTKTKESVRACVCVCLYVRARAHALLFHCIKECD